MNPAAKQILKDAVERSATDPAYFLRFFLPHWFPSDIPPVHLGLIALATRKVRFLNDPAYHYAHEFLLRHFNYEPDARDATAKAVPVFIRGEDGRIKLQAPGDHMNEVIPRGFSKTTLLKGLSLYDIVTDGTMFVVFISASAEHAETQVSDIKAELETNERLRAAYGVLVPTRADPEKWTAREIQPTNGAVLMARGRGGQVRGLTRNGRRPNKIVLDDVEDEDSIATDALREKTMNWFYGSVVPAGQIMEGASGEEWAQQPLQIINLGTLLGAECLVRSLTSDPEFRTIRFGAMVQPGVPLWPYKMSEAAYEQKRASYRTSGRLAQFTREYDSAIRVGDESLFPEIFIYQPVQMSDLAAVGIALDPAISESKKACDSAIVVAGRRGSDGALWFLDEWGGVGKSPRDKIDALFNMHAKWSAGRTGSTMVGIEAVQYQAALIFLMREEMARRKLFFHIEAIRQGSNDRKHARITGILSPRYSNGYLRHLRPLPKLETNLADWPNGKVDYADAAAMALSLLGETSGLVMEGAMLPEPLMAPMPAPEVTQQIGNYIAHRPQAALINSRYPVR